MIEYYFEMKKKKRRENENNDVILMIWGYYLFEALYYLFEKEFGMSRNRVIYLHPLKVQNTVINT